MGPDAMILVFWMLSATWEAHKMGLVGLSRGLVLAGHVSDVFISGIFEYKLETAIWHDFTLWGSGFSPWGHVTGVRADTQVLPSAFHVAEAMIHQESYSRTFVVTSSLPPMEALYPPLLETHFHRLSFWGRSLCLPSTQPPQCRAPGLRALPSKSLTHVNTFFLFVFWRHTHYTDSMYMNLSKLQEVVKDREAWL